MSSCNLEIVNEALSDGLQKGALIHEKTGTAFSIEVITAEGERVLAIVQCSENGLLLLKPGGKVRVELPRSGSGGVVWVQGKILESRPDCDGELVEVDIACQVAEMRQRRMDVRIDIPCTVHAFTARLEEALASRVLNVSADGILVVSDCVSKVGEFVEVDLEFHEEIFHLKGEVIRRGVKVNGAISRTNAAIKLQNLTPAMEDRLSLFVLSEQAKTKVSKRR